MDRTARGIASAAALSAVLIVRAQARSEMEEAFAWYRARSSTAAADFLVVVDQALSLIEEDPERFPVVHGRLRRMVRQRFPYAVYFKIFPKTISVVGVIHGHRHPATWQSRAGP